MLMLLNPIAIDEVNVVGEAPGLEVAVCRDSAGAQSDIVFGCLSAPLQHEGQWKLTELACS